MGIWLDLYGKRSWDFIQGAIAGVEMYAVWKNGRQVVGVQEKDLREVTLEIAEDLTETIK